MFKNVQEWWSSVKGWLTLSEPSLSREAIEDALDVDMVRAFYSLQEAHLRGGMRYGQVLRGGGHPGDRNRVLVPGLPSGLDYQVDEWEGPDGKGWALRVFSSDEGVLTISSNKGSEGWQEVVT